MGMGGMGGCLPGMSGCGVGAGVLVYPGQPCGGTYGSCGGGSFCQSGICCCPTGYSQTMTGCIPNVGMGMGMGGLGYGMGYGMGGLGYGMSGLGYGMGGMGYGMGLGYGMGMGMGMMPMYGGGMGCMGGCGGGAYCQSGMCVCPQNLIYQNSMCMPMYGGGYGGGFGGFGGMGMGLGGGQIVLSINVGGYCQPYSMMSHCVMGATCVQSTCRCMGDFYSQGMYCIRSEFRYCCSYFCIRNHCFASGRLRKDPKQGSNDEQSNVDNTKPEGNQFNPQPPIETINATTTSSSILNWFSKQ